MATNSDSKAYLILYEHKTTIWPLPGSDSVIATAPINTKVNLINSFVCMDNKMKFNCF